MDFYLNLENSQNRLIEEYKNYGSLVVAFDFDDRAGLYQVYNELKFLTENI